MAHNQHQGASPFMARKPAAANHALFEDDFVLRTLGRIGQDPYTALTELVANAWDAGAFQVNVIVPTERQGTLSVEDDGHGMTADQFRARWMKLGYDRAKEQGTRVSFPPERSEYKRLAFGRNGRGRHGLLCFSDRYHVETWVDGKLSEFVVATRNNPSPFFIESCSTGRRPGHGTRLRVAVEHHLPDPDELRTILSARFLHDPKFVVSVNGVSVLLSEHEGLVETETLTVEPGFSVVANVVDATATARSTRYQGVAFWVNNRLVGTPSWVVGSTALLDGRSRFAKRYALVIQGSAEWGPEIEPDWSNFKRSDRTALLFEKVRDYAHDVMEKLSAGFVEENSQEAIYRNREEFRTLSLSSKVEVAQFTQEFVQEQPGIQAETLNRAVKTIIRIQKARSGASFLDRLLTLDEHDIEGLDRILSQWSVQDALVVLDEIDRRLSVVAALEKLSGDPHADELHTLHPLTTQARWLFGPEFESHEFASNNTLRTVAMRLFKVPPEQINFYNPAKRPDLVVLADATVSIVGTERFEGSSSKLVGMRDVLLIELKKGASTIGPTEMNQAVQYVQQFITSAGIEGNPFFHAFVVGHSVGTDVLPEQDLKDRSGAKRGVVIGTTYNQLTLTANRRLHGLKARIPSRYEEVSGYDLVRKVMDTPSQALMLQSDGDSPRLGE